ncbi:hypothetical protein AKJ62_01180 [candidate division MSBL1 archaeon SCGC-AAA259D14]|uniref:phosphoribosylaminoimidazolesuccinocarboxamide synthase n=1 Tax=candidate division MSBL1 archaeon SCGC-AAA259D14 TaxID=1698261 RepID=A0A133U7Z1_9EURY|nr:hypothetical protein AKJ62_01180 [candidate division MSBL1 archaeon SCGC-AAA259D14]
MGSVKDLKVLESPSEDSVGLGVFHFSDRYSVFDWGEMPEKIDRKGMALALMGAYTFEMMEEEGIDTHYVGLRENGEIKNIDELEDPTDEMVIRLVNVLKPEFRDGSYDYSVFQNPSVNNYLLPLEVIYRNRVPVGSSIRERYSPKELGFEEDDWPEVPVSLDDPIIEASTKLEEQDRYITDEEAERISGVSLDEIYRKTEKVNEIITRRSEKTGMNHDDGKLEFLYVEGDTVVGDVAGTFDENRFTFEGLPVSKEVLRQGYKKRQGDWVEEVKEAKKMAKEKGVKDWKKLVNTSPVSLGFEELVSELYLSGANKYIGRKFFDVRELDEVVEDLKKFL